MNCSWKDSCPEKHKQTICHNRRTTGNAPLKMLLLVAMGLLWGAMVYSQPDTAKVAARLAAVENSVFVDTAVRITLTDGITLSGTMARPRQQGAFPVILVVSCYPYEHSYDKKRCIAWADSGYAAIVVFARGREYSQGVFYPFENDAADNYDIIDWVSRQPWCNGKVGMYGGSYLGFTQWAAVKKLHPALKTIVPQASVAPGIDFPNAGGIFTTYVLRWLKYVRNRQYVDTVQMTNTERWNGLVTSHLLKGAAFNRLDSTEGHYDSVFQRWLVHPPADSFWQRMTPVKEEFARINIPILTTTGYFDSDQRGALYYYRMHHQFALDNGAANHYLLIGPYNHHGAQSGYVYRQMQGFTIDSAAALNMNELVSQWFHYCLRNGEKPAFLQDKVAVFVLGENKWRYFPSVEKMCSDTITYYLHKKKLLPGQQQQGKPLELCWSTKELIRDSLDIARNGGGTNGLLKHKSGLTFESDPLEKDIIWTGSPVANLWLSLSVPDADLRVSWWEVDKKGKWHLLTSENKRLSMSVEQGHRHSWVKDQVYHVQLDDAFWTTTVIKKGSSLRLLIAPLLNSASEINYGSSKEVSTQTIADGGPAVLRIYTDDKHPSHILLPVM